MDRESGRRCGAGQNEIVVERTASAIAVVRAASEIKAGEQTHVEPKVACDLHFSVGADINLVETGARSRGIEIPLAKIAEIDSVLHRFRASLNRQVGFLVGFGVLEHQPSPIHRRMNQIIRPVQ